MKNIQNHTIVLEPFMKQKTNLMKRLISLGNPPIGEMSQRNSGDWIMGFIGYKNIQGVKKWLN
jgi:hypothetical protein